ncbi:acetylornithine deacetylase [Thioflexithrix psekupsensis]|uniref:Acetylornithine deacetylase n=1 Tax=Thioflexithrix psekupsensis TaxID=1570016 RepID=A0A251XAB4_9GAMM|nr:acetylornithine deacetylase [Thioflexithrix psekupsensis]OUD15371.1 acetylornithine deacetylase [Thioflexithrix psekupsensis]
MTKPLPPLLHLIKQLIAIPSVSCVDTRLDQSNLAVIEQLAEWAENLGFRCELMPVSTPHPDIAKWNLIATLGTGSGGLVLSGHTDTVPYNLERWQCDPFSLTERDHRLYGLGTSDMKAFFALCLHAAREFCHTPLQHPLIILATADEESSMHGAKALIKEGKPKARHAIIGEPTGLRPVRMHKGIFMESIVITGVSGHSSDPRLGNNALEGMHRVISDLLQWREEWKSHYHHAAFNVPIPTLNLGHIHGGDNPNRICGDCELHIDVRPLPGMDLNELKALLHQRVRQVLIDTGLTVEFIPLFEGIPAVETPANAEIVRIAEQLTAHSAEAVAFATEAPYLTELGMDTIILGPGNIEQAHQPDEYLALDRLELMLAILRQAITHFCVKKS